MNQKDKIEWLLKEALEKIDDGIQIYDEDGVLLYCNQSSRQISTIPDSMEIIGKHMQDIWNVETQKSTVLSCLRKHAPIINLVDTFPSVTSGDVTTVNTAYPLSRGGKLEGAVLFEQDILAIQKRKKEIDTILNALNQYTEKNPSVKLSGYSFDQIVGENESFRNAIDLAQRFAALDFNILLIGETGTGKEMFAQSIHRASPRSQKNFVAVNCAALPDTLIESMLFGATRGAYTGSESRAGLFEEANGGTLFLDELNSMSLAMQAKILRVIQEGTFRRIGSNKLLHTDVRIISSCNEEPFVAVEQEKLRRDLFYRLSSVQIIIPPLRDRLDDLKPLIEHYIHTKRRYFAKSIQQVSPEVMTLFERYNWPGNVRELYHVLDYAMNVMEEGEINPDCLPAYMKEALTRKKSSFAPLASQEETKLDIYHSKLEHLIGDYESRILRNVLEYYGNNISRAAKSLGISRQSLSYRLKKYGILI